MKDEHLFGKRGGYRKLYSFTYATLIHLGTINFCRRFIPWQNDPLGKTAGQMIGAARSGRQNIIEGSERSATSKETEIKLTDVARASLAELLGDFEVFLADRGEIPWEKNNPNRVKLAEIRIPEFKFSDDSLHDYWKYYHETIKPLFIHYLENENPVTAANTLIVLLQQAMAMLQRQLKNLGEVFIENGGFRERMYNCRTKNRQEQTAPNAPDCPDCGKPMLKRTAKTGANAGESFYGCSGYPECRKILPIKKN